MTLLFNHTKDENGESLTVSRPGKPLLQARDSHPDFAKILEGVRAGDESVLDLIDAAPAAALKFAQLTERISVRGTRLFIDGTEIDNSLSGTILRHLSEGVEDWRPLVAFLDNIIQNPQEHSRTQLYDWLAARDFTITEDGMIVAYKGVVNAGEGLFRSTSSGFAVVDGQEQNGYTSYYLGSVVEMPRDMVAHNPLAACSVGLHVGSYDHAAGYGDTLLEVHVNPRDVVSVPNDSSWSKVRCCRMRIVAVNKLGPIHTATTPSADSKLAVSSKTTKKGKVVLRDVSDLRRGDVFVSLDKRSSGTPFRLIEWGAGQAAVINTPTADTDRQRTVKVDRLADPRLYKRIRRGKAKA